jgi:hypothetical protein
MTFSGDRFKPSAKREREVTRLIQERRGQLASVGVPDIRSMQPGHVIAKNETGADLAIGKAALVRIGQGYFNTEAIPRKDPEYRRGYYRLSALTPCVSGQTPYFESFAVAFEPIPDGKFGVVAIEGLAIANYSSPQDGFVHPISGNNVAGSMFGFAKVVTTPQDGLGFSVWDLSCRAMQAPYELTTNWAAATRTATATIGNWSTQVRDVHNIASWQVTGDKGMAVWTDGMWDVITPWCVGA